VKIEIEIPDEIVESYVQRARAAIAYWCKSWDHTEDGVVLRCHDHWEEYRIGRAALKRAVILMAERYPHHFKDILADTGDAYTGDILVQLAAFGEERYC